MELEEKLQAFRKAQEEKSRLQQRIKVLEVVLPVREQQVQMLKQKQQTSCQPRSTVLRITEMATGSGDSSTSDSGRSSTTEEVGAKSPVTSDPDLAATANARGVTLADGSPSALEDLCLTANAPRVVEGGPCGTPAHVIRQFMSLWNQWVREAGLVLHAHDARPRDPGPQLKLAALREALLLRLRAMRLEHPRLPMDVIGVNFETGAREDPRLTDWTSVVHALRFTPEQVADCRAALGLYKERVQAVLAERRMLMSQLASCLASNRRQQQQQPNQEQGPCSCGELMLQLLERSAALQRNVVVEGQAVDVIKDFMGSCLFSLAQCVRASVVCYPHFPDAISILTVVEETAAT